MGVAQQGVNAFVGHAMGAKVPFAMETVFSYWEPQPDGRPLSKIDLIRDMQNAGYFVLLFFVGLANADLSVLRVMSRREAGGHTIKKPRSVVDTRRHSKRSGKPSRWLMRRFSRTTVAERTRHSRSAGFSWPRDRSSTSARDPNSHLR